MDELTLAELNERIVGFNKREDEWWQRKATLTAYIVTALTGKVVKARDLLPKVFPEKLVTSKKKKRKELEEIKKSVGIK